MSNSPHNLVSPASPSHYEDGSSQLTILDLGFTPHKKRWVTKRVTRQ